LAGRDFLVEPGGLRALIENNLPDRNLEDAKIPIHVVATDILTGGTVVLSAGSPRKPSSHAIPIAFPPARFEDADGAISSNTAVKVAVTQGARRLIVPANGLRLCPLEAASRRGYKRVACPHVTNRAAAAERVEGARGQ
jgi:NTE family protein